MSHSISRRHTLHALVGKCVLFLSGAGLHRLLLFDGNYDWGIDPVFDPYLRSAEGLSVMKELLCLCLGIIGIGFLLADFSTWIVFILSFVPIEFSRPFLTLPRFSPLDYICAVGILALAVRQKPLRLLSEAKEFLGDWSLALWVGFFAYCLLSAHYLGGSARGPLRWVGFLFVYFISARTAKDLLSWPRLLCATLSWLGSAVALYGLYQYWKNPIYVNLQGLFLQHNIFSAYLSLCLPAMALYTRFPSKVPRIFRYVMFLSSAMAFILAYSRGAWLGLALGSLVMIGPWLAHEFGSRRHRASILAIGMALVILTFGVALQRSGRSPLSLSDRQTYWRAGLRVVRTHPWRGLGPGNYVSQINSYLSESDRRFFKTDTSGQIISFWQHLHNLYLQQLVNLGLFGFLLWVGALGSLLWKGLRPLLISQSGGVTTRHVLAISILAFLVHNFVDIVTVNSFDMVFAALLATITYSKSLLVREANI